MNQALRQVWSVTWRLGLAGLLMAWAFHAIFHDQCRSVLAAQDIELDALPRLETGKLLRRQLKERYRDDPQAGFVLRDS